MDFYLQGELRGSFSVVHADSSPIAAGESISQDFLRGDFPAGADLDDVTVTVSVILADDMPAAVENPDTLWQFGQTYDYLLGGDQRQGYTLTEAGPQ